ncbi:MAG: aspartate/glutamate racemase family protein [Treponemataceae bacterium]
MRTLGIIGGTSWESTAVYYRLINEGVRDKLGGLHSAHLVLASVDFQEYADNMAAGRWDEVEAGLFGEADRLLAAGVDAILIASNTMHLFADSIAARTGLPLIHIADAAAVAIKGAGVRRVGLLGTRPSMEKGFYKERLSRMFGIEAVIPEEDDRREINRIIFDELCCGVFEEKSRRRLLGVIAALRSAGIEGIVLGCTELPLAIKQSDIDLPLWDTMGLHAGAAVDFLAGE